MGDVGRELMESYVGEDRFADRDEYLREVDPELHRYIVDFAYAQVYSDEIIDRKTRALCTVAMLAALGRQRQLESWLHNAREQGASLAELRAVLRQVAVYGGFPACWDALETLRNAFPQGPVDVDAS